MAGRLALDFGTSNTVIALWDELKKEAFPLHLPDLCRYYQQGDEQISVIPSLIHYAEDNRRWIGNQVIQRGLYQSERTFRWMKRYISHRSPVKFNVDGKELSHQGAGRDFLSSVLLFASQEFDIHDEEIALTIPVEAYEHYEDWLTSVVESAGFPRYRLIDEPSAAALGYGAHIQPGNVYLIFDFGGGTIHAAVILIEDELQAASGRRCRVLGKAGKEIGGSIIDQWIYQEVLRQNKRSDMDEDIRRTSNALLIECERLKERLSFEEKAELALMNPSTGSLITSEFTQNTFEELLDQHELYNQINQVIRQAINTSREHGYDEDSIQAVLMVGGSSQIPSVQKTLRQFFGADRVQFNRPLDAVARGAAAFVAGVDFYDHIQHDYAIRYLNPRTGMYEYHPIVQHGTPYPTPEIISRLTVKATYDGQSQLGIAVFEVGEQKQHSNGQSFEIIFDPTGAARVMPITPAEEERRSFFWMNESNPTFLKADPPAQKGTPRFEVSFSIDGNKRLLVTARDLISNGLSLKDYPVVKLT